MTAEKSLVLARKRQAHSEMQNDVTVLLLFFIATLVVVMLLAVSDQFAEAVALLGSS